MACTTVTIVQQKPVISGLTAVARAGQQGAVDVTWTQDIAGAVTITSDGVIIGNPNSSYPAGTTALLISGLSVGSHSICVTAT